MEDSSYRAAPDCFKCFGVSKDPGFSFDYSTEQVVNHKNENLVMLLNKQYIQFNVCGLKALQALFLSLEHGCVVYGLVVCGALQCTGVVLMKPGCFCGVRAGVPKNKSSG